MQPRKKVCAQLVLLNFLLIVVFNSPSFGQDTTDSSSAKVTAPKSVMAGEKFTVHVELNSAPTVPRGYVSVNFSNPRHAGSLGNTVETTPDKKSYDIPIEVPIAAIGGIYTLSSMTVYSGDGMYRTDLKFEPQSFEVIQPSSFSLPTEAKVTINLSQKQLLQSAAIAVQHKIETLKTTLATLKKEDSNRVPVLLRQNVLDADKALSMTEKEFMDLTTNSSERTNAAVFFEDLHRTYELTLRQLQISLYRERAILPVTFQRGAGPQGEALEGTVLRAFEHNELAYDVVADTQSLTFDLDVRTIPEGATVSYGRRGDSTFRPLQDETNSVIKALPYAIWLVRFVKEGFAPVEREHNPFTDKNHVLAVELAPRNKKGATQH
jgi:hypothetical protein